MLSVLKLLKQIHFKFDCVHSECHQLLWLWSWCRWCSNWKGWQWKFTTYQLLCTNSILWNISKHTLCTYKSASYIYLNLHTGPICVVITTTGLLHSIHRWTQMGFFHSNLDISRLTLKCFQYLIPHWLLLSGMMWILEGLETFSTGRHLMLPFSKEPVINYRSCFHPLATSLQPHCLLPHGTEWHSLEEDPRYYIPGNVYMVQNFTYFTWSFKMEKFELQILPGKNLLGKLHDSNMCNS